MRFTTGERLLISLSFSALARIVDRALIPATWFVSAVSNVLYGTVWVAISVGGAVSLCEFSSLLDPYVSSGILAIATSCAYTRSRLVFQSGYLLLKGFERSVERHILRKTPRSHPLNER